MLDLEYRLLQLTRRNRDGAYATQRDRRKILSLVARQLYHTLNYRLPNECSLKPKHVVALVNHWQATVSVAAQKNRLAVLRWWAEKVGKGNIIPRTNARLGIGRRRYRPNVSKAVTNPEMAIARVQDPYVAMGLRLQQAFGLRREEAMKLRPQQADRRHYLELKASWCKGGRARVIPIRTREQRALLDDAKALAKGGSLIPAYKSYRQQLHTWEYQTTRAGISKTHGLRHAYAQQRYLELTGFKAPAAGGLRHSELTLEQQQLDSAARQQITQELGHHRLAITNHYLGR
ncbi:MAG: integrase domain-containing protein [Gammaproteobacteria bacterium]|nr:integrase domain-containing protein [Gammaproteobacteria bacterium]